jgi:tetratricopeptide (TPR) repeat protein
MKSTIEALKERARRHEQEEQWRKALDLYLRAIQGLEAEDRPDTGLHNRVGDLYTRVGETDEAVEHYETAVDLYEEADLLNNAIAVCKKIIRNVPKRHGVFLRMGMIRARQGFVVDARGHFLTYAERVRAAGDVDEALRALVEFADLVPDDAEVRLALATQYQAHDHEEEAKQQLGLAYATFLAAGDQVRADEVAVRLQALDEEVDLEAYVESRRAGGADGDAMVVEPTALSGDIGDALAGLDDFEIDLGDGGSAADAVAIDDEAQAAAPDELDDVVSGEDDDPLAGAEIAFPAMSDEVADEPAEAIAEEPVDEAVDETAEAPAEHATDERVEEDTDDALVDEAAATLDQPLPFLDFGDDDDLDDMEADDDPLPFLEGTTEPESTTELASGPEATAPELEDEPEADVDEGLEPGPSSDEPDAELEAAAEADTDDPLAPHQRAVEHAFQSGDERALADAYMGLADALVEAGDPEHARGVYQQVLTLDPDRNEAQRALAALGSEAAPAPEVASSEDYVDLGALILGDDAQKSTRFVVAYEEPSGDEDADFKRMLGQFKAKVAENVDASDVRAHHDLGMAYKEMGLLDEAIEQFQKALRASVDHLATYEALGEAFLEKGAPAAAVRVLLRAMDAPWEVEEDLLGIYYYLGRAYEAQGNTDQAVEFYDRVFSLDINFADVTERLRVLR